MTEVIKAYAADYEFWTLASPGHPRDMRTTSLVFTAEDGVDAVRSALVFWQGRNAAIPEHFHSLLCLKVRLHTIGPIDAHSGAMTNPGNWRIFEYKCDTAGLSLVHYVNMRCEEMRAATKGL